MNIDYERLLFAGNEEIDYSKRRNSDYFGLRYGKVPAKLKFRLWDICYYPKRLVIWDGKRKNAYTEEGSRPVVIYEIIHSVLRIIPGTSKPPRKLNLKYVLVEGNNTGSEKLERTTYFVANYPQEGSAEYMNRTGSFSSFYQQLLKAMLPYVRN